MLAAIVYVRSAVEPSQPIAWSYQVLTLCLLAAVIAGRALLGFEPKDAVSAEPPSLPRWAWLPVLLAASLPYLSTLRVGFLSDDYGLLSVARSLSSPLQSAAHSEAFVAFHRPFAVFVWWLGTKLWAGSPVGYHALSLALHSLNAVLVYLLARRLITSTYAGLMAGLLFALHPIHVETVTWLAASTDLLCTAFGLSSLLLLERSFSSPSRAGQSAFLASALLAFLLALLSKEAALALPGVVLVRLALLNSKSPARRPLTLVGAYAAILLAYGLWRVLTIGGLGGYALPLTFWNTIFPSAPLLMLGDFLFPVNRSLFLAALPLWSLWIAIAIMALGAFWWARGTSLIPGRRLWLWLGFLVLLAVPTWIFLSHQSSSTEWNRFAYLPTVGLAWLFGDLCAARGPRRSAPVAAAILIIAAALTIWTITPWRQAGRMSSRAVAAGADLVRELSHDGTPSTLYVTALPSSWYGAQVLAYSYPQALSLAVGRPVPVRMVTTTPGAGGIYPDVMAHWKLKPGEYFVSFDPHTGAMRVLRSGDRASPLDVTPGTPDNRTTQP